MPDTSCSPAPLPEADRAKLVEGVQNLARRIIRDTTGLPQYDPEFDDLFQDCLMEVWEASVRFDPAKAKFTTFAAKVFRNAIATHRREAARKGIPTQSLSKTHHEIADRAVMTFEAEPDDGEEVATNGLRTIAAAPIMADLGETEREIFQLVAVDGLSAVEIAARRGQKLSIIEIAVRGVVRKLIARGVVPSELLAKFERDKEMDKINPARKPRPDTPKKKKGSGGLAAASDDVKA